MITNALGLQLFCTFILPLTLHIQQLQLIQTDFHLRDVILRAELDETLMGKIVILASGRTVAPQRSTVSCSAGNRSSVSARSGIDWIGCSIQGIIAVVLGILVTRFLEVVFQIRFTLKKQKYLEDFFLL